VDLLEHCKDASANRTRWSRWWSGNASQKQTAEAADRARDAKNAKKVSKAGKLTLVDVAGVGLLPGLGALLLVAGGGGGLLASLLLLSGCLSGRGLATGSGSLLCFGRHFGKSVGVGNGWVKVVRLGVMVRVDELGGAMDGEAFVVDGGGRATYGERAACCDPAGARWSGRRASLQVLGEGD